MSTRMSYARAASVEDTRTSTLVVAASNSLDPTKADPAYRCTGANDDVEINAALVAAAAVNGSVELLEGDYNTVLTLSVAVNVTLKATGWGAVINFNAGGHAVTVAGDNVKLRDFKVVIYAGAGIAATRPNCIYATGRTNLEITKVWLKGDVTVADEDAATLQNGILLTTVTDSRVAESRLEDNFRSGVTLTTTADQNTVVGNTIIDCGRGVALNEADYNTVDCNVVYGGTYGIGLFTSIYNGVVGNVCRASASAGILVYANNNTVTGNTVIESSDYGIWLYEGSYNTVTGNTCNGNTDDGIYLATSNSNTLTGNTCYDNDNGFYLFDSLNNTLTGNTCPGNALSGISIAGASANNTVTGNTCQGNGDYGIGADEGSVVVGNTCQGNGKNGIDGAANSVITGNHCRGNGWSGIDAGGAGTVITGNNCSGNTYSGIHLTAGCDHCTISGNVCNENVRYGISLQDGDYTTVTGNTCVGNDYGDTGTYDGIGVYGSASYNLILGNWCKDNDRCGIHINSVANVENVVKDNLFSGNTAGPIIDNGTDTKLATKIFQFTEPLGTATFLTTSPTGIEVNLADEGALAVGEVPLEVQMVVRFRVKGVGLTAPGAAKGMLLEININAGKPTGSEAYNAEAIAVPSVISTEDDFAINDAVEWIIDATDDVDVDDIAFGETIEMFALFEDTGANADIATDALLRTISIEYV